MANIWMYNNPLNLKLLKLTYNRVYYIFGPLVLYLNIFFGKILVFLVFLYPNTTFGLGSVIFSINMVPLTQPYYNTFPKTHIYHIVTDIKFIVCFVHSISTFVKLMREINISYLRV